MAQAWHGGSRNKDFRPKWEEKRPETREHFPKVRAFYLLDFTFQAAKFFLRDGVWIKKRKRLSFSGRNHISEHYRESEKDLSMVIWATASCGAVEGAWIKLECVVIFWNSTVWMQTILIVSLCKPLLLPRSPIPPSHLDWSPLCYLWSSSSAYSDQALCILYLNSLTYDKNPQIRGRMRWYPISFFRKWIRDNFFY